MVTVVLKGDSQRRNSLHHVSQQHHSCSDITIDFGAIGSVFLGQKEKDRSDPPPTTLFYPFPIHPSRNVCVNFGVQHDQFIGVAWPAFLFNTAISQPSCPLFALLCPCNFPSPAPPCCAPLSSAARLSHACRYLGKTAADLNCETPQNLFRPWPYNLLRLWNCDLNQSNWPPTANTLLVLLRRSHIHHKRPNVAFLCDYFESAAPFGPHLTRRGTDLHHNIFQITHQAWGCLKEKLIHACIYSF